VLASAELDEGDAAQAKRPSVQIGDPFEESKLLECCLELLEAGLLVALQDLGAAGLTSSSAEMASKGGLGIDLDVARVPLREADMEPFEIMVSESQERMLAVVAPERLDSVLAACARWEVGAAAIGEVTDTGRLRVLRGDELEGDVPVSALVDECPLYDLEPVAPPQPIYPPPGRTLDAADPGETLLALLASPNLSSRRPVFEQYDSVVQSRTVRRPAEADAAVLLLPDGSALAVSIDGNGRRVACDPYVGAVEAVLECAANLACVGAEPVGLTNCLNFGNPEKPHVAWQLDRAVSGLADACGAVDVPVVGGNVSLYNEGPEGPIYPTPVVGIVGCLPDAARAGRLGFAGEGDVVALAGERRAHLPGSELAKLRGEALPSELPEVDVAGVAAAQAAIRDAVRAGELRSAHDVAEGGLATALAEACLAGGLGATVRLPGGEAIEAALFGEGPGGFVVSGPADAIERLGERLPVSVLGEVGGDRLAVDGALDLSLADLRRAHAALSQLFP
jgi:phosphoribosylformylglycinamidine synthase